MLVSSACEYASVNQLPVCNVFGFRFRSRELLEMSSSRKLLRSRKYDHNPITSNFGLRPLFPLQMYRLQDAFM